MGKKPKDRHLDVPAEATGMTRRSFNVAPVNGDWLNRQKNKFKRRIDSNSER